MGERTFFGIHKIHGETGEVFQGCQGFCNGLGSVISDAVAPRTVTKSTICIKWESLLSSGYSKFILRLVRFFRDARSSAMDLTPFSPMLLSLERLRSPKFAKIWKENFIRDTKNSCRGW